MNIIAQPRYVYTVRIVGDSPKFNDKISNHSRHGDRKSPEMLRSSCPPQQKSNQSPNRIEISDPQLSDEYSGIKAGIGFEPKGAKTDLPEPTPQVLS